MRVLMISKALVTGLYQRKLEELAKLPDIELRAIVPPYWREGRVTDLQLEQQYVEGYEMVIEPMRFNGHHHIHYYPGLARQVDDFQPDLIHVDEEPYNLVAAHAARHAQRTGAALVFFAWQNLLRRYPPPFRQIEQYVYRVADAGMAGNQDARYVLRQKGFRKPVAVVPQVGVDPEIHRRIEAAGDAGCQQVIGFVGRLVPEKGVDDLIDAFAMVAPAAQLWLVGAGSHAEALRERAGRLGVLERVTFIGQVAATEIPELLSKMSVLVLPSRTRPNWKEQFGRILVEAMACETPVIGSSSGEIPHVIGDGGLVFPEGDTVALAEQLRRVLDHQDLAKALGDAGRKRVLERFTQQQIARSTYDLYLQSLDLRRKSRT